MGKQPLGTPEEIEAKLRAGGPAAWLSVGELAVLFGRHRTVAHRWLAHPQGVRMFGKRWPLRIADDPGGNRTINPEDVIALLDAWRDTNKAAGRQ